MVTMKDEQVNLNLTKSLTQKQLARYNALHNNDVKQSYLLSLLGLRRERLNINKFQSYTKDPLHKDEGSIRVQMSKIKRLNQTHLPTDNPKHKGQWVGVEIECFIPHQSGDTLACGECSECNEGNTGYCENQLSEDWDEADAHQWLRDELRNKGVHRTHVKADGSLKDEYGHGVELAIVFNTSYGYEQLTKLCKALSDLGCYVNKTCGLHVHLDSRHLSARRAMRVGKSLGHTLPVLKYMVAPSRLDNTYCKLKVGTLSGDRYCAINMAAFNEFKTIEVRLHQGSINAIKIQNWIEVLRLAAGADLKQDVNTFQELIDMIELPDYLVEYCDRRIQELNPDAWPQLNTDVLELKVNQGVA